MPRKKKVEEAPTMYEGYDIRWLRKLNSEHPDYYLVEEYDAKYGKKGGKDE